MNNHLPGSLPRENKIQLQALLGQQEIFSGPLPPPDTLKGYVLGDDTEIAATLGDLTDDERQILLDGCLINHYGRNAAGALPF